jgi:thiamine pyrophosphate-dependent acetolactate synthase large subunit-like protein
VFLNGLARGCVPADDPSFLSRARGAALRQADVALVVGAPLDFRSASGRPSATRRRSPRSTRRRRRGRIRARRRFDFVSYAGRVVETYEPGCWMDPGPYGCLGSGPGYALAAKLARPERQVCLLLGDGAFGFSGLEFDTNVRHGVAVVGNNGIWGLEKHPMEYLYGYSVAADLQPGCRYDLVVEALGGHGEPVERPAELRPALEHAFASGRPALVNVLTDPSVAYPRSTNLA